MIRNRPKRRKQRPVTKWVALAYNSEGEGECGILAFAKTKRDAILKAECRLERQATVEAFPINDAMAELVYAWLKGLGLGETDTVQAVRAIGDELLRIFA